MQILAGLVSCLVLGLTIGPLGSPAAASTDTPGRHGEWPLQPRPAVVEGFDPPASEFGRGHRGVDLLGHAGQEVRTSLPGRVSFASVLAGRGVVVVDHGDLRTTYEPVAARVHVGDVLPAGAVLGTLQAHGSHCWPRTCLHWGLLRERTYLDPLTLVGAGPVRLVPLTGDIGSAVTPRSSSPPWSVTWSFSGTPSPTTVVAPAARGPMRAV